MKYFDLHCDTISECCNRKCSLAENDLALSLERTRGYESWAQIFAVWIDDCYRGEDAFRRFTTVADYFDAEAAKNAQTLSFCRTASELEKAEAENKRVALLSIEGSAALAGSLHHLEEAKKRGVCLITLTWNGRCEAGDGCGVPGAGGLTPFGRDLVREMNRLNIVPDVSHLSEKGFWDVVRLSKKPIAASHSDSKAVCGHRRNLTDDQFRAIVSCGGVVGLNLCDSFVREKDAKAEDILRHTDHFLALGGENTLALGSDLDGCTMAAGIGSVEEMSRLYDLLEKEYGTETAGKIFWGNAERFFLKNLD